MLLRIVLLVFLFLTSIGGYAQSFNKAGSWGLITVVLPGSTEHRWGGYTELQTRTNDLFYRQFYYYEVKGGVSYNFSNNFAALLARAVIPPITIRMSKLAPQLKKTAFGNNLHC